MKNLLKLSYYVAFVLLSILTLGALDIDVEFSNGQKLTRTGWLGFVFAKENK